MAGHIATNVVLKQVAQDADVASDSPAERVATSVGTNVAGATVTFQNEVSENFKFTSNRGVERGSLFGVHCGDSCQPEEVHVSRAVHVASSNLSRKGGGRSRSNKCIDGVTLLKCKQAKKLSSRSLLKFVLTLSLRQPSSADDR